MKPITRDDLTETEHVLLIGALAVKQLQARSRCAFFINLDGVVELCDPHELALDAISEEQAIRSLLGRGYTDSQLIAYLKGRKARGTHGTDL